MFQDGQLLLLFVLQSVWQAAVQHVLRSHLPPPVPPLGPGPGLPDLQGAAGRAALAAPPVAQPQQHGGRDYSPPGARDAGGVQQAAEPLSATPSPPPGRGPGGLTYRPPAP